MISVSPGNISTFWSISPSFSRQRRRVFGQPLHRDHHVEHRHVIAIRDRLRFGGLADHPHLAVERTDEARDHHRHQRILHVFLELVLQLRPQLGGGLAGGQDVGHQRHGDPPVWAHRQAGHAQLRRAIHRDTELVAGAYHVMVASGHLGRGQARPDHDGQADRCATGPRAAGHTGPGHQGRSQDRDRPQRTRHQRSAPLFDTGSVVRHHNEVITIPI
jgi:hypothetical protein